MPDDMQEIVHAYVISLSSRWYVRKATGLLWYFLVNLFGPIQPYMHGTPLCMVSCTWHAPPMH